MNGEGKDVGDAIITIPGMFLWYFGSERAESPYLL
jgi:hypothetical protein